MHRAVTQNVSLVHNVPGLCTLDSLCDELIIYVFMDKEA